MAFVMDRKNSYTGLLMQGLLVSFLKGVNILCLELTQFLRVSLVLISSVLSPCRCSKPFIRALFDQRQDSPVNIEADMGITFLSPMLVRLMSAGKIYNCAHS